MKPIPPDKNQIAIWKTHGKNIRTAASEIGIAPSTLRARLIVWGAHDPSKSSFCRDCGNGFWKKTSQVRCPGCVRKRENRKKRGKPELEKPELEIEYSRPEPHRQWNCRWYDRCLSAAAKRNCRFHCGDCLEYDQMSINERAARRPSCAAKRIAGFAPVKTF